MLEQIKKWLVFAAGVAAYLLVGWIFALNRKIAEQKQQLAVDQAKQGIADAVAKVAQDTKESTDADQAFNSLADAYTKSHSDGKS